MLQILLLTHASSCPNFLKKVDEKQVIYFIWPYCGGEVPSGSVLECLQGLISCTGYLDSLEVLSPPLSLPPSLFLSLTLEGPSDFIGLQTIKNHLHA